MTTTTEAVRPGQEPGAAARWRLRGPLLPALLVVILITQIPFVLTLFYSVQRWNLISARPRVFNGLDNFTAALGDAVLWKSLGNTAVLTVGATVVCLVVGLGMALLLNAGFPGQGLARTLAITPFFAMPVAVTLFWKSAMFDSSFGLLGWVTDTLGMPRIDWLSQHPMAAMIILIAWRWTPFALLVLLAGLQALPADQLEAAKMDGAGPVRQFRYVTLPFLRPFLELATLLLAMNILQTFGEIALLTAGGPAYATTNITFYIYQRAFNAFDLGAASAYGLIALVLTIAIVLPTLRLLSGIFQREGRR